MFKINIKLLIIVKILLCFYNLPKVQCNCELYVSSDSKLMPRFERHIDEIKLEVNITNNKIEFGDGESLTGFCETYFRSLEEIFFQSYRFSHLNRIQSLELSCKDDRILFMDHEVNRPNFECHQLYWNILYSNDSEFSWCKNLNCTSLFLSSEINKGDISFAEMCYDLEKASLRTIHYTVQSSQKTNSEMISDMNYFQTRRGFNRLLDDLQLLKTTKSVVMNNNLLRQQLMDLYELNPLLSFINYEVSSIVQGHSYADYFKEYNNFLNTIWWRNLRLGNWKIFINTLENYAHNNSFEMFTGTSGIAEYPINLTENERKKLELQIDMKTVTVPAYIWSYVRSSDGENKDFIIIAYNSPYAEFFSLDHIIFCPDICADIPWLKDVYTSFRYTFAGIIFCCSPDFIKEKNPLEGFPIGVLNYKDLDK